MGLSARVLTRRSNVARPTLIMETMCKEIQELGSA